MNRVSEQVDHRHGHDPFDVDDRTRCQCVHADMMYAGTSSTKVRCLNLTRHPSGRCHDCRPFEGEVE